MGYWLAVIAIIFLTFVLAGGLNPSQQTQIDGSTILIFLVMYLPVAVLRTRDMGASWWSGVVIIFVVGSLFFIFLFLWLGIAKSTAGLQQWNLNKPLPIITAIVCVFFAIMAVIIVLPITTVPQPSGTNPPDLTVCDTWLREQLDSPEVTSVQNANAAITDIQANRPNQCAPSAWNPVVDNVAKDYVGNIDVKFWITNTNLRGTAVTMPTDGTPRWVYLAEKGQWYSAKLDDQSVLATPPTSSNQSAPNSTTARPNTSRPTPTVPMSLLMRITEGEIGSMGQGLNCDNLLQQQLLVSPLATANADNANAVIASIQSQRPSDCPQDTWNPWVTGTAGTSAFNVNVPPTLSTDGTAGKGKAFTNTPLRDQFGNMGVDFDTANTVQRGAPTTLPIDRSPRWMYLSYQGIFYGSMLSANTTAPILMPTADALWTAPTSDELQNVVSPTLQTVHTLGIPTLAIIGQVKNVTGRRMGFIQGNCQVYVGDIQVASTTTFTNSLAPGAKWQYQADLFDETLQGSNYNIECLFDEW